MIARLNGQFDCNLTGAALHCRILGQHRESSHFSIKPACEHRELLLTWHDLECASIQLALFQFEKTLLSRKEPVLVEGHNRPTQG